MPRKLVVAALWADRRIVPSAAVRSTALPHEAVTHMQSWQHDHRTVGWKAIWPVRARGEPMYHCRRGGTSVHAGWHRCSSIAMTPTRTRRPPSYCNNWGTRRGLALQAGSAVWQCMHTVSRFLSPPISYFGTLLCGVTRGWQVEGQVEGLPHPGRRRKLHQQRVDPLTTPEKIW